MKVFFRKSKRYDTAAKFVKALIGEIHTLTSGHKFDLVMAKAEEVKDDLEIRFSDESKRIIILRVKTYRASVMLGMPSWCISYSPTHWQNYVSNGGHNQYFIFNFNVAATNALSCIGVTIDGETKRIRDAQDRFDMPTNKGGGSLLKMFKRGNIDFSIADVEKMCERERVSTVLTKYDTINGAVQYPFYMNGTGQKYYHDKTKRQQASHSEIVTLAARKMSGQIQLSEVLKIVKSGQNIDKMIALYQHYNVCVRPDDWKDILQPNAYDEGPEEYWDYYSEEEHEDPAADMRQILRHCNLLIDKGDEGGTFIEELNLMPHLFNQLHSYYKTGDRFDYLSKPDYHAYRDDEWKFSQQELDDYIKTLRLLYTKQYDKFEPATRQSILSILQGYGDDTMATVIKTKNAKDADLTEYEFNNGVLRGMKMQPLIQKKIKQLERGEDVDFNAGEVRYAINNGYKKLFYDQYQRWIQEGEMSIDYDAAQIIQLLGLSAEAGKMLAQRVADGGVYVLNSIEHSIYDIERRSAGA